MNRIKVPSEKVYFKVVKFHKYVTVSEMKFVFVPVPLTLIPAHFNT